MTSYHANQIALYLAQIYEVAPVETIFGLGVPLKPLQAIEMSTITGAGYLNNHLMPLSLRPFSKVFSNNLSSNLTSGMFDQGIPRYAPWEIVQSYPFILSEGKVCLPVVANSEEEYSKFLESAFKKLNNPENFLILKVENWKKGAGLEPLLELSATLSFKLAGCSTENQISLEQRYGSPDFVAFSSPHLRDWLEANFGITASVSLAEANYCGYFLEDLISRPNTTINCETTIVGEAKVGGSSASKQLRKYMDSKYFSKSVKLYDFERETGSPSEVLHTANFTKAFDYKKVQALVTDQVPKDLAFLGWITEVFKIHFMLGSREREKWFKGILEPSFSFQRSISEYMK